MKQRKKDLILLGVALLQLKEQYKIKPNEFIENYNGEMITEQWNQNYPTGFPLLEELKLLAKETYGKINKQKNIKK